MWAQKSHTKRGGKTSILIAHMGLWITSIALILDEIKTWPIINYTTREKNEDENRKIDNTSVWKNKKEGELKKLHLKEIYIIINFSLNTQMLSHNSTQTHAIGYQKGVNYNTYEICHFWYKWSNIFYPCWFLCRNECWKPQTTPMDNNHQSIYCRDLYSIWWWEYCWPNLLELRPWPREEQFKRDINFSGYIYNTLHRCQ